MSKLEAGPSTSPVRSVRPKSTKNDSSKNYLPMLSRQSTKDYVQQLDPDEIFAKHTVPEVKSILNKLCYDIDAKQEELRLMVGERYRDLLEASTSIISMSESSKRVVNTLDRMKAMISMERNADSAKGPSIDKTSEDGMLHALQCLAAHLKLLLDTPEHLWRFLERKRYLHAAWLFLLARVVHRSLIDESVDEGRNWVNYGIQVEEKFPLVQRQWEAVSQFRSQISHKATLSLRERVLSSKDLCTSLLSLHLLDSLPLSNALDLLLKQRTRALNALCEAVASARTSPAHAKKSERSSKEEVRFVRESFQSVLSMIVITVSVGREAFDRLDNSQSMMEKILAYSQKSNGFQLMLSIPEELRLTTESLIGSLPNSNHFAPLPSDIKSFQPFVDSDSSNSVVSRTTLNQKLRTWFTSSLKHLENTTQAWFARLTTIKEVWEVRTSGQNWLAQNIWLLDTHETDTLSHFIEDLCGSRAERIWKLSLRDLLTNFSEHLLKELSSLVEKNPASHIDAMPTNFLLSAPPISSVSQASLGASIAHSSFMRFKRGIKLRLDGMSPVIENIVSEVELAATSLRNDLDYVFSDQSNYRSLKESFIPYADEIAQELFVSLENLVDEDTTETERPIQRLVFLGRLVLKLTSSSILACLHCSDDFIARCMDRAQQLYRRIVDVCASEAAKTARDQFMHIPEQASYDGSSGPSSHLMDAMLFLIQRIESHCCFDDYAQRITIVKTYLRSFTDVVGIALDAQKEPASLRLVWDLRFLIAICGSWGSDLTSSCAALEKSLVRVVKDQEINGDIQADVLRCITRVRLLLLPLLAPSESSPFQSSGHTPMRDHAKVKVNGGPPALDQDPQLPLQLVKPSARFGSLWVGTAKSQ